MLKARYLMDDLCNVATKLSLIISLMLLSLLFGEIGCVKKETADAKIATEYAAQSKVQATTGNHYDCVYNPPARLKWGMNKGEVEEILDIKLTRCVPKRESDYRFQTYFEWRGVPNLNFQGIKPSHVTCAFANEEGGLTLLLLEFESIHGNQNQLFITEELLEAKYGQCTGGYFPDKKWEAADNSRIEFRIADHETFAVLYASGRWNDLALKQFEFEQANAISF